MPKKKLTVAEKIARIPIEEISRIGGKETDLKTLKQYAQTLRTAYNRRISAIRKKGLYSFAGEQLAETKPYKGSFQKIIDSESDPRRARNKLILEIAKYQQFFNAETATVSGIEKIQREQDKRIFGVDSRGRPKNRMSEQERQMFWSLYNEYNNQYKNASTVYGSESIQSAIGEIISAQGTFNLTSQLQVLNDFLKTQKEEAESAEFKPNVLSGIGSPFSE